VPLLLKRGAWLPAAGRPLPASGFRIDLVKQVQQWWGHPGEPISLETLAARLTSPPQPAPGFSGTLGMGPDGLHQLEALHGIRRELPRAQPESVTVAGLAAAGGFSTRTSPGITSGLFGVFSPPDPEGRGF